MSGEDFPMDEEEAVAAGAGPGSDNEPDNELGTELDRERLRVVEALLFASAEPLSVADIAARLPAGADVAVLISALVEDYAGRGVNLVPVAGKWMFRTAADLGLLVREGQPEERRLSRAALETLATIAYHQPVTRAEIEDIRGVSMSKGTLDVLMEVGFIRMRGRRRTPGRPITYGTTEGFLVHFGLEAIGDLPGLDELKGAGLFDQALPPSFKMPVPRDSILTEDEDPLDGTEDEGDGEAAAEVADFAADGDPHPELS
ncbi:MAG: SMC-Scp complex subunit ScpB [Hyphomicrobiales bacterium]